MKNWPDYDRALVARGDLTLWITPEAIEVWRPAPSGRRGAQPKFSDLAIETALEELMTEITELEAILADPIRRDTVIKDELAEIREEFGSDRRTSLELDMGELDIEDLIDDDNLVVTLSSTGYIKSVSTEEFRAQARGGRGVTDDCRGHR